MLCDKIEKIFNGHDSREEFFSLNDKTVKEADKVWRYSSEGFHTDIIPLRSAAFRRARGRPWTKRFTMPLAA